MEKTGAATVTVGGIQAQPWSRIVLQKPPPLLAAILPWDRTEAALTRMAADRRDGDSGAAQRLTVAVMVGVGSRIEECMFERWRRQGGFSFGARTCRRRGLCWSAPQCAQPAWLPLSVEGSGKKEREALRQQQFFPNVLQQVWAPAAEEGPILEFSWLIFWTASCTNYSWPKRFIFYISG
ncbi:hypothetical protein PIB30_054026 [Stylosanthes scabra]|uniref:Uncharacterized protein n=1 Tax=Stylosanthes scabra TaxID=79078 RepID=A0ABU6YHH6_9FABA|nr:hypothetical protein [Stylosanthes scabra]